MKQDRAFAELEDFIKKSPDAELTPDVKKKFENKVKETKEKLGTPLEWDKWIYRFVVGFLGFAVLSSLFFTFYLSVVHTGTSEIKVPDIFLAIGSAAVGALAGLLAPSPTRGGNESA
jgi:hypothetical protein